MMLEILRFIGYLVREYVPGLLRFIGCVFLWLTALIAPIAMVVLWTSSPVWLLPMTAWIMIWVLGTNVAAATLPTAFQEWQESQGAANHPKPATEDPVAPEIQQFLDATKLD